MCCAEEVDVVFFIMETQAVEMGEALVGSAEGEIGASGALARSLRSKSGATISLQHDNNVQQEDANSLESASHSQTQGIQISVLTDADSPAVVGSIPSSPATLRHGSVSGSPTKQQDRAQSPAHQRRNDPLGAKSSPSGPLVGDNTANRETGNYLEPMTTARLNSV